MNEIPDDTAVVAQRLHLATGFLASERGWVVARLAALGSRLGRPATTRSTWKSA
jgi:hypothetical protein